MPCIAVIFVLFLCTTTVKCVEEKKNTTLSHKLSNCLKYDYLFSSSRSNSESSSGRSGDLLDSYIQIEHTDVFIKDVKLGYSNDEISKCRVCYLYPYNKEQLDKLHIFNLTLNCKFGRWILQRLFSFMELSPLLYQYKFQTHPLYDEVFKPRFKEYLTTLLSDFYNYIDRFINALRAFDSFNMYSSFYNNNATILKIILSLKMKSYIIPTIQNKENANEYKTDFEIIQLFLIDMIDIQRFLTVNCSYEPTSRKNSQMFGIWISVDQVLTNDDIEIILDIADRTIIKTSLQNKIDEESDYGDDISSPKCSYENIFLVNIIDLKSATNPISIQIMNSKVKITEKRKSIPLSRIYTEIKKLYDIDVSLLFYDYVVTAIMKIIVSKTKNIIKTPNIKQEFKKIIILYIKEIHLIVSLDKQRFPEDLVRGFEILSKIETSSFNQHYLDEYFTTLSSVKFKTPPSHVVDADTITSKTQDTQTSVDDEAEEIITLLEKISINIQDFKCFMDFFEPVRNDQQKYYVPLLTDKYHLFSDDENEPTEKCSFISNIYKLGYQAYFFLNAFIEYADNPKDKDKKTIYLKKIQKTLNNIRTYNLLVLKSGVTRVDILKVVFSVATILVNLRTDLDDDLLGFKVIRVLTVIMNEMNSYFIRFCTTSETNFLIFNNIDFNNFGNGHVLKLSMINFFSKYVYRFNNENFDFHKPILKKDHQFLDVRHFHDTIVKTCKICSVYKNDVMIKWNGLLQSMEEVFNFATTLIFDPLVVFELYDMFIKFSAALIFFQIKENSVTHTISSNENIKQISNELKLQNWIDKFPKEIDFILKTIDKLLDILKDASNLSHNGNLTSIDIQIKKIEKQFNKFGIVFINKSTSSGKPLSESFPINLNNLFENVSNAQKKFIRIILRDFDELNSVWMGLGEPEGEIPNQTNN